jgi:hypothetical protein
MTAANDQAIRRALEAAGIEFIAKNGGGIGVRLRAPRNQRKLEHGFAGQETTVVKSGINFSIASPVAHAPCCWSVRVGRKRFWTSKPLWRLEASNSLGLPMTDPAFGYCAESRSTLAFHLRRIGKGPRERSLTDC